MVIRAETFHLELETSCPRRVISGGVSPIFSNSLIYFAWFHHLPAILIEQAPVAPWHRGTAGSLPGEALAPGVPGGAARLSDIAKARDLCRGCWTPRWSVAFLDMIFEPWSGCLAAVGAHFEQVPVT